MLKVKSKEFSSSIATGVNTKTGYSLDIMLIIQIIYAIIQIYKFCNKDTEKLIEDVDNMSLMNRAIFKKVIRKHLPSVNKKVREELLNEIIFQVRQMKKEELNVILAEFN